MSGNMLLLAGVRKIGHDREVCQRPSLGKEPVREGMHCFIRRFRGEEEALPLIRQRKVVTQMAKRGGDMTVREAGKMGGEARKEALGPEGYSELGKKGGQTTKERHGPGFYSEIGRKGGEVVRRERGPEFFSEIGRKGGQKVRELIERGKRSGK
jgi:general stress protein YciG